MTIGDIMDKFNLPDLCGALADSLDRVNNGQPLKIGGRRAADTNTPLPFDHLQVWTKVQLQNRSYHTPHHILPPQTINGLTAASKVSHHLVCPSHPLTPQVGFRASYRPSASYCSCRPIQKSPRFSWYRFISRVCSAFQYCIPVASNWPRTIEPEGYESRAINWEASSEVCPPNWQI